MPGSRPVDLTPPSFSCCMTSTPFSPSPLSGPSSNWSPAGPVRPPTLHPRAPLLRRPRRPRTRVSLPSLLQPRRLVPRRPRHGPGTSPRRPLRPHRADPAGPRRHAVSQTRPDSFRQGMHHDPLMSSKALKVFRGGHDWVVLFLLRPGPACLRTASNGSVYRIQPIACRAPSNGRRAWPWCCIPGSWSGSITRGIAVCASPRGRGAGTSTSPRLRTCGRASVAGSGRRIEPTSARKAVSRESSWSSCWKWPAAPAETAAPRRQQ